jgi:hypothetical protein
MKSLMFGAGLAFCMASGSLLASEQVDESVSFINGAYQEGKFELVFNKVNLHNVRDFYWNDIPVLDVIGDMIHEGYVSFVADNSGKYLLKFNDQSLSDQVKSGVFKLSLTDGTELLYPSKASFTTVTDSISGITVEINSSDNMSIVTNTLTGESEEVEGIYEWMTDADYTALMDTKRNSESADESVGSVRSGSFNGRFSNLYSLKTRLFYVDTSSVRAKASIDSSSPSKNVNATLYRDIAYWPDQSYGGKDISNVYQSWAAVQKNANYYFILSSGTKYWAYGTLYTSW